MLKQSPSRNQRVKGFKVKHALQIFLLLAICIWLVYQLKHSHDKKALEESSAKVSGQVQNEHGTIELGRRGGLHPRVEEALLDVGRHREKEEESEEEVDENKAEESEEEGRVNRHYQEKSEEESEGVEDLIDEDDTEREEESEEQENEDKGNDLENLSLEDQVLNEDTRNTQEAREEHYKGDDASSAVKHNTRAIEIGRLRRVKEEEVESAEIIDLEKDNKATGEKRGSTTDNLDAANLGMVSTEKQLQSTANSNDNAIANRKSNAYGRVENAQERSMTLNADKSGSLNSSFYQEDRNNQPILETLPRTRFKMQLIE